ncbi:MAG: hypothetical protein LH650_10135 [Chloroflexi bacterium]|nr:hypothetical protein [Chloroflexota bacterium]
MRTKVGGKGKAHALNQGLEQVLSDDWAEAILIACILFPGVVSVAIIGYACLSGLFGADGPPRGVFIESFLCVWLAGCMAVAWLAMRVEHLRGGRVLSRTLLYISGHGAFLCLVTLTAYIRELRGAEQHWDKTEKRGRALLAP